MILKASQRGGAMQLGAHLLKPENEHVEVHEIRGFIADDVKGAMKEAQAIALGTRCKQFLFSVSLNPPETESVSVAAFESAIDRIEAKNGLTGQPRIVIFHEKEGRRHAHAVWSRIDPETMTARPLPFFKTKLRELSKELYLEHGWQMPRGLMDSQARDPRSFSLAEWQQAKRIGRDPAALKALVQDCWGVSDTGTAFKQALEERGLYLARGDRRAHVAVTYEGEVLSIARMTGKKAKEVTAKLGAPDQQRSVAETREHIAAVIAPRLQALLNEADRARTRAMEPLEAKRLAMKEQHTRERQRLDEGQRARAMHEAKARTAPLRTGVVGLWDRLTGRRAEAVRINEREAYQCFRRDRDQRQALIVDQLKDRRGLQRDILAVRRQHAAQALELHRDIARANQARQQPERQKEAEGASRSFNRNAAGLRRTESPRSQQRETGRRRGPDLGR